MRSMVKLLQSRRELSGRDLSEACFCGLDLRGCCFDGADLSGSCFECVNLENASLVAARLNGCRFGVTERRAVLADSAVGSVARRASLAGARLSNADCSGCRFTGVYLARADLAGARLIEADLCGAVLLGACLRSASLDRSLLRGADLREADLRDARLHGADLDRANLFRARVTKDELAHARAASANLLQINADFTGPATRLSGRSSDAARPTMNGEKYGVSSDTFGARSRRQDLGAAQADGHSLGDL
jgi:uncharacterized protein YjbI with pentapeptide repeats